MAEKTGHEPYVKTRTRDAGGVLVVDCDTLADNTVTLSELALRSNLFTGENAAKQIVLKLLRAPRITPDFFKRLREHEKFANRLKGVVLAGYFNLVTDDMVKKMNIESRNGTEWAVVEELKKQIDTQTKDKVHTPDCKPNEGAFKKALRNRKSTVCNKPGCSKKPKYNYISEHGGMWCNTHKNDEMIDMTSNKLVSNFPDRVTGQLKTATLVKKGEVDKKSSCTEFHNTVEFYSTAHDMSVFVEKKLAGAETIQALNTIQARLSNNMEKDVLKDARTKYKVYRDGLETVQIAQTVHSTAVSDMIPTATRESNAVKWAKQGSSVPVTDVNDEKPPYKRGFLALQVEGSWKIHSLTPPTELEMKEARRRNIAKRAKMSERERTMHDAAKQEEIDLHNAELKLISASINAQMKRVHKCGQVKQMEDIPGSTESTEKRRMIVDLNKQHNEEMLDILKRQADTFTGNMSKSRRIAHLRKGQKLNTFQHEVKAQILGVSDRQC